MCLECVSALFCERVWWVVDLRRGAGEEEEEEEEGAV